ncbi:aspartate dehydrogenase [Oceaniglobus trochenteri]|uniref:aspartate dehydrogenase n=1 Tax=Oceaniglobus trochenteri TaxID=2763260 RepID=UPI001CFFC2BC|nr:aspartate dehydrogenase [Oceaniglobus trochenteri]
MNILMIGHGALAAHVAAHLPAPWRITHVLCRPGREDAARVVLGPVKVLTSAEGLVQGVDLAVELAGQGALARHGPRLLARGLDVLAVSTGALADPAVEAALTAPAPGRLELASGAIGALDALAAARCGGLDEVTYRGRKPPRGWAGSPAEQVLDLAALRGPTPHFSGTAREAARLYPKNANVAASVALAGIGFDRTTVELIADPDIAENIHELTFSGGFGTASFRIAARGLPDNPRSSALTAMSVLAALTRIAAHKDAVSG